MRAQAGFPSTKRGAKREACRIVGLLIENYFDVGQPYEQAINSGMAEDDRRVVNLADALKQLQFEMERRS